MAKVNFKLNKISRFLVILFLILGIVLTAPKVTANNLGILSVTSYSSEEFPGQTASGPTTLALLAKGGSYVASNLVPFGTHLCGPKGLYLGKVVDLIGSRSDVDRLVRTTQEAIDWGRQRMRVHKC